MPASIQRSRHRVFMLEHKMPGAPLVIVQTSRLIPSRLSAMKEDVDPNVPFEDSVSELAKISLSQDEFKEMYRVAHL